MRDYLTDRAIVHRRAQSLYFWLCATDARQKQAVHLRPCARCVEREVLRDPGWVWLDHAAAAPPCSSQL